MYTPREIESDKAKPQRGFGLPPGRRAAAGSKASLHLAFGRLYTLRPSAQGGVTRQGVVLTYLVSFLVDS